MSEKGAVMNERVCMHDALTHSVGKQASKQHRKSRITIGSKVRGWSSGLGRWH